MRTRLSSLGARGAGGAPVRGAAARLRPKERARFAERGYLVFPSLLSHEEVDAINGAVERAWSDHSIYNAVTASVFTSTPRCQDTYLRTVPLEARRQPMKINHLYLYDPGVLAIIMAPKVQSRVKALLGGDPVLFNSLNMERGTEQPFHSDVLYMPPRTPGAMVALWFALQDVEEGSGALQYYPGSHAIEPYVFSHGERWALNDEMPAFEAYMAEEITKRGLVSERFHPRKGDVFVWHAQLFHGGSPIENPAAMRRSLVTHFWRADDLPPEQLQRVPGGIIQRRDFMCVPTSFRDRCE